MFNYFRIENVLSSYVDPRTASHSFKRQAADTPRVARHMSQWCWTNYTSIGIWQFRSYCRVYNKSFCKRRNRYRSKGFRGHWGWRSSNEIVIINLHKNLLDNTIKTFNKIIRILLLGSPFIWTSVRICPFHVIDVITNTQSFNRPPSYTIHAYILFNM